MFINLHIIQSVPASLLNRDDMNSAKGLTFGNVRRDRVSSQSWKRAVRTEMRAAANDADCWADRTTRLPSLVAKRLVDHHGIDSDIARAKVDALFAAMGLKLNDKGATTVSIYAATSAVTDLANFTATHLDDLGADTKTDKDLGKTAVHSLDVNGALDLALFGRMLAELPVGGRIDGAAGFSHAIGVTPTTVEADFFTTVDDHAPEGEAVSTNLGTTDLTSPTLYRHIYLDTRRLVGNLNGNTEQAQNAARALIRHSITALPDAKARSTAAHTLPDVVVATIGGQNLSAANAFADAITDTDVTRTSVAELLHQIDAHSKVTDFTTFALPLSRAAVSALDGTQALGDACVVADDLDGLTDLLIQGCSW